MTGKQIAALQKQNKKLKQQVKGFSEGARSIKQINQAQEVKVLLKKKATPNELHIIKLLSENRIKFEFQKPIYTNPTFIVLDFLLPDLKIVIEIDGGQHFTDSGIAIDINRDKFIKSKGYKVFRLSNSLVETLNKDSFMSILKDFQKGYLKKKLKVFNDYEILTFGKYSGYSIDYISKVDKSYLIWMYRSLIGKFSETIMDKLNLK